MWASPATWRSRRPCVRDRCDVDRSSKCRGLSGAAVLRADEHWRDHEGDERGRHHTHRRAWATRHERRGGPVSAAPRDLCAVSANGGHRRLRAQPHHPQALRLPLGGYRARGRQRSCRQLCRLGRRRVAHLVYPINRDMWTGFQQGGSTNYGPGRQFSDNFSIVAALKNIPAGPHPLSTRAAATG